jgi:tryptophanyl-tRNA synthetase
MRLGFRPENARIRSPAFQPLPFTTMRIFSGIQPTGRKHLGNYLGAIRRYVEYQAQGEAIYCIVDLHAITVAYDAAELPGLVLDTTALLMAAGLEPDRCILFRQGDVHEHTELAWLLASLTPYGELQRMTQFKEKAREQRDLVSAGLFTYPVLQTADIVAYGTHVVPVGEDQRQHLEIARNTAERFNHRYGEAALVVPEHRIPEIAARVMDLQAPDRKMSTTGGTEQGTVHILDEPDQIRRKFKSAVTDSGNEIVCRADKPGITNLIEILAACRGVTPTEIESAFAGAGYGSFKSAVAEAVVELLAPIRDRYEKLRPDEPGLVATLETGAEKARTIASATLATVRDLMGVAPPRTG